MSQDEVEFWKRASIPLSGDTMPRDVREAGTQAGECEEAGTEEEYLLWRSSFSWWLHVPWLFFVAGICALSWWVHEELPFLLPWLGGLLLCSLGWQFLRRLQVAFTITSKRVECVSGLFLRQSKEVRLQDIRSIEVKMSGVLGLLGVGDVEFSSAGSDDAEVLFERVGRAHRLKRLVRDALEMES